MKHIVNLHIEKLPEGFYIGTSDDVPGLAVQGCTIAETMEIARDAARQLVEVQDEDAVQIALASNEPRARLCS
ncbi:MAG: type II toxin-antitoxin system HicB family antitoxin [Rhodomicrobium sp.]